MDNSNHPGAVVVLARQAATNATPRTALAMADRLQGTIVMWTTAIPLLIATREATSAARTAAIAALLQRLIASRAAISAVFRSLAAGMKRGRGQGRRFKSRGGTAGKVREAGGHSAHGTLE